MSTMFQLTAQELAFFKKLNTPMRVQDYLDSLPFNFEKHGDTLQSPRAVLQSKTAHCFEGALLAAAAFWINGGKPLLLDLVAGKNDDGHVIALFKQDGYWGAVSKTNHGVLRFRDPMYKTVRELALSYFHEYFLNTTGEKTLRTYSKPCNLQTLGESWVTSKDNLWYIDSYLDTLPHSPLFKKGLRLRPASKVEREAGAIVEWKK